MLDVCIGQVHYQNINYIYLECRRSDGRAVTPNLQENTNFSMEREMRIMNQVQVFFFVHKRIISAIKRVEFVSDRMSYIYIYIYIILTVAGVISLFLTFLPQQRIKFMT
jgi:hypothetical protein